jgi:peroxiredoxin
MNLTHQLNHLVKTLSAQLTRRQQEIIAQHIEDMTYEEQDRNALRVGDRVPDFSLPDIHGHTIAIRSKLREGPVVLTFFRGGWCAFCNLQLRAYQQQLVPSLKAQGASLIAISPQTPEATLGTVERQNLTFDVLSDQGNRVARQFGLVYQLDDEMRQVQRELGIDLRLYNHNNSYELPLAATYVIDPSGRITYAHITTDFTRRADPDDILAALAATAGTSNEKKSMVLT